MTRNKIAGAFEPEFVEKLKNIFEDQIVFNRLLGLKITAITAEGVKGLIDMKPDLIGHFSHKRLHGGVISAGLDAMAGLAVMAAIGARHMDEQPLQRLQRFGKVGTIDLRSAGVQWPAARLSGPAAPFHPRPIQTPPSRPSS